MYYFWTVGSVIIIGKGKEQCAHSEARGAAAAAAAEALLGGW